MADKPQPSEVSSTGSSDGAGAENSGPGISADKAQVATGLLVIAMPSKEGSTAGQPHTALTAQAKRCERINKQDYVIQHTGAQCRQYRPAVATNIIPLIPTPPTISQEKPDHLSEHPARRRRIIIKKPASRG
jgi:hypothetical protein